MKKSLLVSVLVLMYLSGFAQITNNTCSTADILVAATGFACDSSADTANATMSGSALSTNPATVCNYTSYKDVWFQFTATSSQHTISLSNVSPFEARLVIAVFSDCSSTTPIACARNVLFSKQYTPGQVYKIRVMATTNTTASLNANFTICVTTPGQNLINASSSQYTTEQLVNNVLLNNACQQATNITSSTGTNYGSVNGIGSFEKGNSNFQFQNGIILSTGTATYAAWPPNTWLSSGDDTGWLGDTDLSNTMAGLPGVQTIINASVVEFDFVPQKDNISIRYIFGSNDYGSLQCYFSDGMAFLLTDLTAQTPAINIAVVPGTTIPVCVTTIMNGNYGNCSSVNSQYFGNYYAGTPNSAPIGLNGVTVPLTAEAAVIPGHLYHLKMVIADEGDTTLDAAVFIDAENFDIGIPKNPEITSSNGLALCEGETTTLSVDIEGSYTMEWTHNGLPVGNENSTILEASQAGEYTITINPDLPSCSASTTITILNNGIPEELLISDYTIIDNSNDNTETFDLSLKTTEISTQLTGNYDISYYESYEDARNETNPVSILYTNISNPQLMYARIENSENGCAAVRDFSLSVQQPTPVPSGETQQTFYNGETLADLEITGENVQWYANSSSTTVLPTTTTPLVDGSTYYASQTINNIESSERLAVTASLIIIPAPTGDANQTFNNGDTLTNLEAEGENIQWYADSSSTVALALTTLLVDGTTYYASQTINNTESIERLAVTVSLITVSSPTGASEQTFFDGQTLADLEVEGENIQWYDNDGEGMPDFPDGISQPLPLTTVLVDGTTYYASQTIDSIESSQRLAVTVYLIIGLEEKVFSTLKYYPNPANNLLNIENTTEI
ncbi:MAG: hypothetical protein DI539_26180, partial [Flavobacterium psychrophilum]